MAFIQVAAHGFDMTQALRDECVAETTEKLQPLALHNFSARWILSLEGLTHVARLHWNDGPFHGDVTEGSPDMYMSITRSVKIAVEQMKKAHEKRYEAVHVPLRTVASQGGGE